MKVLWMIRNELSAIIRPEIIDNIMSHIPENKQEDLIIIPVFNFTSSQTTNNSYLGPGFDFFYSAILDYRKQLELIGSGLIIGFDMIFEDYINVDKDIKYIIMASDPSPFAVNRDKEILLNAKKYDKIIIQYNKYILDNLMPKNGDYYKKYSPFLEEAKKNIHNNINNKINGNKKNNVNNCNFIQYTKEEIKIINIQSEKVLTKMLDDIHKHINYIPQKLDFATRSDALTRLKKYSNTWKNYGNTRDDLTHETSNLSAYIKCGLIDIREILELKPPDEFIRQLIWREFYAQIMKGCGHYGPLKPDYNKIMWDNNKEYFNAWKNGKTGFPIVDAGMRQLNKTHYMHNRARLITASFLVKILLIDWKWGEKYFAEQLYDYDVSNNNGNWQWVAGCGADSQPYFRIFNPWIQTREHDPEAKYIKTWVDELKNIDSNIILNLDTNTHDIKDYPNKIVDYKTQKNKVLEVYKYALSK